MENSENSSALSANENMSDNKDDSRNITTGTTNSSPNPSSPSVPSNETTTITALSTTKNHNKNDVTSSGKTDGVTASTGDSTPLAVTAGACTLLPSTAVVVDSTDSERTKVGISGTGTVSNDINTDSGGAKEMTPIKSGGGIGAPLATAATQSKTKEALGSGTGGTVNPKISSKSSLGGTSRIGTSTEKKNSVSTVTAKTTTSSSSSSSGGTKSLKKGARKKRKSVGTGTNDEAEKEGNSAPKKKKVKRKKEKDEAGDSNSNKTGVGGKPEKSKKNRKQTKKSSVGVGSSGASGSLSFADHLHAPPGLTAAQMAVQEQMRKALEEDQYSANGSIVDTDTDDDDHQHMYKGHSIRLDRSYLLQTAKKNNWLGNSSGAGSVVTASGRTSAAASDEEMNYLDNDENDDDDVESILNISGNSAGTSNKKITSKPSRNHKIVGNKKKGRNQYTNRSNSTFRGEDKMNNTALEKNIAVGVPSSSSVDKVADMERDEGSIFGQTTGSSNSTWVECDKCKKWRRLRGVVDERKLPPKWYCTMNKNDPERARCSAPEEEYDAAHTPESAADARTRKHLRVWVRRLQCNEQYESRLPTLTRGKKRSVASSSKEPHEWIRCCNPSCGKWRAILRIMDAKQNVIDRTSDGEWYCVMNTWDEKTASCAAPQENLPAVGCPPWVLQDAN